jgi:hypothetical protein
MEKFKLNVSNWELTFEDGQIVNLDNVLKESSTINANGKSSIRIEHATFNTNFLDLFKQGAKISNINQKFELFDNIGAVADKLEYNYSNMEIKSLTITGNKDEPGIEKIIFATNK